MWIYLLKSSVCLATLLFFYKLFLERESFHVFKRFFLLGALLFSLIVPALVFTEEVVVVYPSVETTSPTVAYTTPNTVPDVPEKLEVDITDFSPMLWAVYFIGLAFFGFRFLRNFVQIVRRIRNNPKQRVAPFIRVLLGENLPPHTFFSYIFLNKCKLQANDIPEEVLLHEETHARQKHSIDVFLIELVQVILWFNPLVYFLRKYIKLNHEFLADSAVLKKGVASSTYQNTLLSFMSPAGNQAFINAINYSSIKKRFTVMKKNTSKRTAFLKSLLVLPLLAVLLFSFTETKIVYKPAVPEAAAVREVVEIPENADSPTLRTIEIAGLVLDSETLSPIKMAEIHASDGQLLTKTDENGYFTAQIDDYGKGEIHFELSILKDRYRPIVQKEHWGPLSGRIESVFYFGLQNETSTAPHFSELVLDSRELTYESVLGSLKEVTNRVMFNKKMAAAKKGNQDILIEIDDAYYVVNDMGWIQISSPDDLISIDDQTIVSAADLNHRIEREAITGMTPLTGHEASYGLYTTPGGLPNETQVGASSQELTQYTNLAKKYNEQPVEQRIVPLKELKVLETIYQKMTAKQRKGALPFPECQTVEDIYIYIQNNEKLLVNDKQVALDELATLLPKFNTQIARKVRQNNVRSYVHAKADTSKKILKKIESALVSYGVATINIVGPEENLADRLQDSNEQSKEKILFILIEDQKITLNGKTVPLKAFAKAVDALTADWEETDYTSASTQVQIRNASSSFLKKVDREFKKTHLSKANGGDGLVPPPPPPPASPQMANHIAVHPPTPPVAVAATIVEEVVENEEIDQVQEVDEVQEVFPEPVPPAPTTFGNTNNKREAYPQSPPSPPEPQSPLDHVIEMAKKGATFYYEEKEISSDKAIELLKKNKNLNIDSRGSKGKNPVVKISKHPIKIGAIKNPSKRKLSTKLLDYATLLKRKNAFFYLDNHKISAQEGLEIIETHEGIIVETLPWISKTPEVRIYTKT